MGAFDYRGKEFFDCKGCENSFPIEEVNAEGFCHECEF